MSNDASTTPPAQDTNTDVLLERAKQGRQSAFSTIFRRHLPFVVRYVRAKFPRRRGGMIDSQDIVQDAFRKVFAGLPRFEARGRGALRAYMRRTIDNLINDEFRQIGRRPPLEPLGDSLPDPLASPHELTVAAETAERYRRSLTRLRAEDRVLIAGYLELGYTHEQLAFCTNRPTAEAARVALGRALGRLAVEMARE